MNNKLAGTGQNCGLVSRNRPVSTGFYKDCFTTIFLGFYKGTLVSFLVLDAKKVLYLEVYIAGTAPPIRQIFEEVLRKSNSRILAAQYRFCEIPRELEFGMLSICLPLKIQRILWDFLFFGFLL